MDLRTPTRCDTDSAAQELLAAAIASAPVQASAQVFNPGDDPAWTPGAFEFAAAVRQHLPAGLEAADFDGVNVQTVLGPVVED